MTEIMPAIEMNDGRTHPVRRRGHAVGRAGTPRPAT